MIHMTLQGSLLVLLENNSGRRRRRLRKVWLVVKTAPVVSLMLYVSCDTYLEALHIHTKMCKDAEPFT